MIEELVGNDNKNHRIIEELVSTLSAVKSELIDAKRKIAYYENPHTPPSQNNIPNQKKKKNARKEPDQKKKSGRSIGHVGTSHSRKSSDTRHHTPKRCKKCGSINIKITKTTSKQITDFKVMPKLVTTTHVSNSCTCNYCNTITEPETSEINGTGFGPYIAAFVTLVWTKHASLESITDVIEAFGVTACKTTILRLMDAMAVKLKSEQKRSTNPSSQNQDTSKWMKHHTTYQEDAGMHGCASQMILYQLASRRRVLHR